MAEFWDFLKKLSEVWPVVLTLGGCISAIFLGWMYLKFRVTQIEKHIEREALAKEKEDLRVKEEKLKEDTRKEQAVKAESERIDKDIKGVRQVINNLQTKAEQEFKDLRKEMNDNHKELLKTLLNKSGVNVSP